MSLLPEILLFHLDAMRIRLRQETSARNLC